MSKSILIVEDEGIVAMDIKRTLQGFGYSVIGIVPSGEEAIEKVKNACLDLILMNISLRGNMDGIEAVEKIHENSDIPIIYITGHFNDELYERAKKTKHFRYLKKPLNTEELQKTIEAAFCKK
ncbi:MAG: response regulator [Candidatus Pacearchaeota archaeon]|nr:MAG: response regulator [Candidatus Pacearchaeota archaeon]